MINELENIKKELMAIKARNARVEADKAWERSKTRVFALTFTTYIVASIVLNIIGNANYLLSGLIPAIGYFLSTQSLPFVKEWWLNKYIGERK
ncbi:TPA: hypothetical protein DDW69_04990 [candidate division CPR2 bacterium]|uniref:2TM domain-containing protein n=1 Tax=candidate division CPR2 bacterium GW2011_GWC1_41_48 TaxID=1618344 RepID=A0A0G0WBF9_UNCC2|nr:MAG: hypothetical protein UT47_C0002G0124 [candidate division CPR2 bacterium GW2011_GWC2_39_35]KKR27691.1 MAG: hypothetical protein UT60_C0040G0013 [candidate division CPR2 bacterium GW2011_GWD2_39_7]KKR28684.1 MAG: hypothetical protein UT59_C0021G0005 [candidate division CPR2 bacterium GW2011_GWD1_39_7]KKS09402.1 MAG: hypothetical protein UU65_C0002G0180 [candidate division CPR2 bacterium GW2011_GWC1_41_48]OGB61344.1 MAG: hypothetical protein A2Y27_00990 [candidate division CPR2 bacterium G